MKFDDAFPEMTREEWDALFSFTPEEQRAMDEGFAKLKRMLAEMPPIEPMTPEEKRAFDESFSGVIAESGVGLHARK